MATREGYPPLSINVYLRQPYIGKAALAVWYAIIVAL
jgi:hypothetical protein